jgi:hypothetical protein
MMLCRIVPSQVDSQWVTETDLYDLLCRSDHKLEEHNECVTAEYAGTLHRFLADPGRKLVGNSV